MLHPSAAHHHIRQGTHEPHAGSREAAAPEAADVHRPPRDLQAVPCWFYGCINRQLGRSYGSATQRGSLNGHHEKVCKRLACGGSTTQPAGLSMPARDATSVLNTAREQPR